MFTTAYVVVADPHDRAWIEFALAPSMEVVFLSSPDLHFRRLQGAGRCVIVTAEEDGRAALALLLDLKNSGSTLPVIVLGPSTALRSAVANARLDATVFLERPVSVRQFRDAVRWACVSA
jgi:FixJ family two-component response regulator